MDQFRARDAVDRVIAALGGGRVLCLGDAASQLAAAFRDRAVDAHTLDVGAQGDSLTLPREVQAFDIVYVRHALDALDREARSSAIRQLRTVTGHGLVLQSAAGARDAVEREWLAEGWRKHPLYQVLVPYTGLDWERDQSTQLFEPLPAVEIGQTVDDLAAARELHTDMLREPGRRADAHVARYMFARQFIRPGDRVLDAACGLGYGTAILNAITLAESVTGIDTSEWAIAYASAHYGRGRPRVSFTVGDVRSIADLPPASLDAIVSFETLEHLDAPDAFLADCRRVLTPAGRIVCSVPNDWTNAEGIDPNPYHLHVFDRDRLEQSCRRHFFVEHVYGQTAGGGMKLPDAGRTLWRAQRDDRQAEWWLLVGMTEPSDDVRPMRHGLAGPTDDRTNVLAFERDYENPWLVRAMVTVGLRTESAELLTALAATTLAGDAGRTADVGAALCVEAYRYLEAGDVLPPALRQRIRRYVAVDLEVPHAFRWQVSLHYVLALSHLQHGQMTEACRALEACATSDALRFAPHLATKTVGAAFLRGWIALQSERINASRHWWKLGVDQAERALRCPWSDLLVNRDEPALFGLREAAVIVDLASQCATGLALLHHAADRPGLVASQLFESLRERAERARRVEVAPLAPVQRQEPAWSLLDHAAAIVIREGNADQTATWTLTLDGKFSSALLVHPPACIDVTIPTGHPGRLTTAVAIHPDAWGRPNTSACAFSIRADNAIATTIVIDPHRREADRRWIELEIELPATSCGTHELTLETRTLGSPDFAWALFRNPVFQVSACDRHAADRVTRGLCDGRLPRSVA
jgi:SAM-dependent methyltransferase